MARLPIPGQDKNIWGGILNDFLYTSLNTDGTFKGRSVITVGVNADYNFSSFASPQAAIQKALNDHTQTGATIVINSNYTLTGSVYVRSNINLTHLPGVVCSFNSGVVNGEPQVPNNGFNAYTTSAKTTNFRIYGMNFDGQRTMQKTGIGGYEYHAIYIRHESTNFIVSDIYGTNICSGVVRARDNCTAFTLEKINVNNVDGAVIVSVGCNNFTINDIKADTLTAEALMLQDVSDFTISNLNFNSAGLDGTNAISITNNDLPDLPSATYGCISNVRVTNAFADGVYLRGGNNLVFSNIYIHSSGMDGFLIYTCNNISVSSLQVWNSNRKRSADGTSTYCGINIYGSNNIHLFSPICDDDGDTPYLYRGIITSGTSDFIKIVGGHTNNTISTGVIVVGNNSTCTDHSGYNPSRYKNNGTVSAYPILYLKNADSQEIVLARDVAMSATFDSNVLPGQRLTLKFTQDATGGHSVILPNNFHLTDGDWQAQQAPNAVSILSLVFTGSSTGWYETSRSPVAKNFVNVKDYGAKGNGAADDTAAIQLAINQGGTTFFPAGVYMHSGLTLLSGTHLLGVNSGGYVKNYSPTNQSVVPTTGKSALKLISGSNVDAITILSDKSHGIIENIEIDGNKTGQTTNTGCIKFTAATNVEEAQWKLNNIYVHNGRSYGLSVGNNRLAVYTYQSVYESCGVDDSTGGSGIVLGSTDNTIDSCLVYGSWGDNVKILSGTNRILNCEFFFTLTDATYGGSGIAIADGYNCSRNVISGCTIDSNAGHGIYIGTSAVNNIVSNCIFHSNSRKTNGASNHLHVKESSNIMSGCCFVPNDAGVSTNKPNYAVYILAGKTLYGKNINSVDAASYNTAALNDSSLLIAGNL